MKILLFLAVATQLTAGSGCHPITGDRVRGRDLALADSRFAGLPESLVVAWLPAPGARRVLSDAELMRIAIAHGIRLAEPADVCFEIPLRPLTSDEAVVAMRAALPGVDIQVVEMSKAPVAPGELVFPVRELEPLSVREPGFQTWRGYVSHSPTNKTPVWARVSLSQMSTVVVARRDLPPGVPVNVNALRVEERRGPPVLHPVAARMEDVQGRMPKKLLKAGEPIPLTLLERPPDVRRGDTVQVEVSAGAARLQISAIAERDGRSGELIELRNPSGGRIFRARLDGHRAFIVVATEPGS